jgi:hypothetical protein
MKPHSHIQQAKQQSGKQNSKAVATIKLGLMPNIFSTGTPSFHKDNSLAIL